MTYYIIMIVSGFLFVYLAYYMYEWFTDAIKEIEQHRHDRDY